MYKWLGVTKSSLFPLTSPKKLGTVGRHNFFFLFSKKVTHFYIANMFIFVIFTVTGKKSKLNTIILMNCQQNCNKLKKISKLGLIRIYFLKLSWKNTLGSAWKITVSRVSGNKQLFFYFYVKGFGVSDTIRLFSFLRRLKMVVI